MVPVHRNSENSMVLGTDSSDSSLSHMVPQRFYTKVTYDEHTNAIQIFQQLQCCATMGQKKHNFS